MSKLDKLMADIKKQKNKTIDDEERIQAEINLDDEFEVALTPELEEQLDDIIMHVAKADIKVNIDFIEIYIKKCLEIKDIRKGQTEICLKLVSLLRDQVSSLTNISPRH